MKMLKGYKFYIILLLLILVIFFLGYFVYVNLFLKDRVLTGIDIFGQEISVSADESIESQVLEVIHSKLPEQIPIDFAGQFFIVDRNLIEIQVDTNKILSYGKGKDLINVWKQGLDIITNSSELNIKDVVKINILPVYNALDFKLNNSLESLVIQKDSSLNVYNCEGRKFYSPNTFSLNTFDVLQEIQNTKQFSIPLDSDEIGLVKACRKYNNEREYIKNKFIEFDYKFDDTFGIQLDFSNNSKWFVKDYDLVYDYLNDLARKNLVYADSGQFEVHGANIYLFKNYQIGKQLNFEKSLHNISLWITEPSSALSVVYEEVKPEVLNLGKNIIDFTKVMGVGQTRIDVYRNGYYNYGLDRGQDGILELENAIIQPKKEFSYINHINPQPNGLSVNGRAIGAGICNATTTLFRAALESGLPITDRSYHAHNYDSYSWGYPLNIVDAAYLTYPVVDFKFINDTDYPILVRTQVERKPDNWQYHSVYFYTSSDSPSRKTDLYDWKKWNVYGSKNFEGSFKRKVTEGDKIIRDDEFYSKYW